MTMTCIRATQNEIARLSHPRTATTVTGWTRDGCPPEVPKKDRVSTAEKGGD